MTFTYVKLKTYIWLESCSTFLTDFIGYLLDNQATNRDNESIFHEILLG